MQAFTVHKNALAALHQFELPEKLGFGLVQAPVMYSAQYQDGMWSDGYLEPTRAIEVQPSAKVLHYGQEIFEGMKAYRVQQDRSNLFRPEDNWARFNHSARRMAMPEIPLELFMQGVYLVTAYCEAITPVNTGQSLYLRPFMFASEASLEVSAANQFTFMVIASPSEAIHIGSMRVLIEREMIRASRGGTGSAKTGGNYASSFASRLLAQRSGFDQSLWLDAQNHKTIEELSVMNFFAVIDGELHTPALTGSLLEGITRDSIIQIAKSIGLKVIERAIDIDELIRQITSGQCSEAFCCGTGIILSPIRELGEHDGTCYPLQKPEGDISQQLRARLIDIQECRADDPFGWIHHVPENFYPGLGG
jgi:branched-chain amino acid aminotransferase